MKKKLFAIFLKIFLGLIPIVAFGQFEPTRGAGATGLPLASISDIIFTLLQWLLAIFTFIAVLGFVISGLIFITAGGSERAATARSWLTYTVLGTVIGLIGFIVLNFIDTILSGTVQQ